jgi:hypothetical protein
MNFETETDYSKWSNSVLEHADGDNYNDTLYVHIM